MQQEKEEQAGGVHAKQRKVVLLDEQKPFSGFYSTYTKFPIYRGE